MDDLARKAFADWTRAQPAVSAFVHAIVADRSERDDVLQEIAMAVLESYGSYDQSRPFVPWALGLARRVAAESFRRRKRMPMLLTEEATASFVAAVGQEADAERDRLVHLADCLKELDGRAREICDLRYRLDLSPARIAGRLGLQPNTASKALQRVREQLRECIERRTGSEARA